MNEFSQLLSLLMAEKKVKTYALAQYCGYDRANMYKIINGKRNPPSAEFVEKISKYMHLSPAEDKELKEAYEITLVGYDNYYSRKDVMNFFSEFALASNLESPVLSGVYKTQLTSNREPLLLNGIFEISSAIFHVIAAETNKPNGHIRILLQPELESLMSILASQGNTPSRTRIDHIMCLNNKPTVIHSKKNYNLQCLKNILPIYNYNYNYHTYYYYDSILSLKGSFSLFPYMILTSENACLLTSDVQRGWLTKDTAMLRMLTDIFDHYILNATPLLKPSRDIFEQVSFISSLATAQSPGYCFQMTPCISYALTAELLERCLKPNFPDRAKFISYFSKYIEHCNKHHALYPVTYIFSLEGIQRFLDSGQISEYPSYAYKAPSLNDRVAIIKHIFFSDNMAPIKILKQNVGNFDAELYLYVNHEQGYLTFAVPAHNILVYLNIEEPSLLATFYDFCDTLNPDLFFTPEEANLLIEAEIKKRE